MKNLFITLAQKTEECRKHLFNKGFSYKDADEYTKIIFEETGLKFGIFDFVEKEEIINAINYLDKKILS